MTTLNDLNKQQLAKFLEGFNALIDETQDSSRSLRGYKGRGFEAARTIVLALQLEGGKNVHAQLRKSTLRDGNLEDIQTAYNAAANKMGYGPNSSAPLSIA